MYYVVVVSVCMLVRIYILRIKCHDRRGHFSARKEGSDQILPLDTHVAVGPISRQGSTGFGSELLFVEH